MKNKLLNEKSSQKVAQFLEKNSLHKKDFAEMIGVTLSYVYNLIDETIPFSTRSTTLERIATVMDVSPEEFEEYRIPQEPIMLDKSVQYIKNKLNEENISVVNFLKLFPRKRRKNIVDMLRGALPVPIDFQELETIGRILSMNTSEIYKIWELRMKQVLQNNGMNLTNNNNLIDSMFTSVKKSMSE